MSRVLLVFCVLLSVLPLAAQVSCPEAGVFANSVSSYVQGSGANPSFVNPTRLLCAPLGFSDVLMLGVGGSVTVGFPEAIIDGPGTDFVTYENGFVFGNQVFGELGFVEVSTDGVNFARFPNRYFGPATQMGPFDGLPPGCVENLAGLGSLFFPADSRDYADPFHGGGDPFDLADLATHPLVASNLVNLQQIQFVRIVDVLGDGTVLDSTGAPIFDPVSATSSSDWDAIAVAHVASNQAFGRPAVTVAFDAATRTLRLRFDDASGVLDLDFATVAFAINEVPYDLGLLLPLFPAQVATATSLELVSLPVPAGVFGKVVLSVRDLSGLRGADGGTILP